MVVQVHKAGEGSLTGNVGELGPGPRLYVKDLKSIDRVLRLSSPWRWAWGAGWPEREGEREREGGGREETETHRETEIYTDIRDIQRETQRKSLTLP